VLNIPGRRSAFLVLLVTFFSSISMAIEAKPLTSDQLRYWAKLLHFHEGTPQIYDEQFLLTSDQSEWSVDDIRRNSLALLLKDPTARCRFPARYLRLVKEGGIESEADSFKSCSEYLEFKRRVPVDTMSIIFASEHLTQPSSIMGHVMLSMSGVNSDGNKVDHAASFFTTLDFANPASLIADTLISGKPGFFIVQPLSKSLNKYLFSEQRNVWRYPLAFSAAQLEMIQAHMWELGGAEIPYLFQSHNCATLSLDLVRLEVDDNEERRDWVSPIDVVRYADKHTLISERRVIASDRWQISMLQEFMSNDEAELADTWVASGGDVNVEQPLTQALAKKLARYRAVGSEIGGQHYEQLQTASVAWPEVSLELTDYRDPLQSAPDSHVSTGWQRTDQGDWVTFNWLPAAHDLLDNNRNYFGESVLRLSELSLRAGLDGQGIQLNRWTLYETLALNPRDKLTGGVSGYFSLAFSRDSVASVDERMNLGAEAGVGTTYKASKDIGTFAMLGAGLQVTSDQLIPYLRPQAGLWIYEVGAMKSWLKIGSTLPATGESYYYGKFDHSIELGRSGLLTFGAERKTSKDMSMNSFNIAYRYYY
jgi:hypothetical protein